MRFKIAKICIESIALSQITILKMANSFKKYCFFCIAMLLLGSVTFAQTSHKYLREGDSKYIEKDYTAAEENYRKSLQEKSSAQGAYNLGNSIYNQERFDEAIRQYNEAIESSSDNLVKSKAYHNLGNAHFGKQEFDKSIDAYKNALRLNSTDLETKRNLALAQKQLLQQQQQQQQQQQEQNQENSEEQEEQQDQQQQQQQQQEQPQDEQQEQQQQGEEEKEEQVQEKELSKEEAQKLLEIMEEEERKVQEKMRKQDAKPNKSDKDW